MNKKVMLTMILISWMYLLIAAILKLIFIEDFMIEISNTKLIAVGEFIDSHVWLREIIYFVSTYLTYWLYLCAVCQKWRLSPKETAALAIVVVGLQVIKTFVPITGSYLDMVAMILIPYAMRAEFRMVAIIYSAHVLGQLALLYIRGLVPTLADTSFIVSAVISFDAYVWLIIYYLYSNKYKGDFNMGKMMPPLFNKGVDWLKRRLDRIDGEIVKTERRRDFLIEEKEAIIKELDDRVEKTEG